MTREIEVRKTPLFSIMAVVFMLVLLAGVGISQYTDNKTVFCADEFGNPTAVFTELRGARYFTGGVVMDRHDGNEAFYRIPESHTCITVDMEPTE